MLVVLLTLAMPGAPAGAADGAFLGGAYRADQPFPEFMPLWREGWNWTDETGQRVRYAYEGMPLGGYVQVYIRNTTPAALEVEDVLLNGISLAKGIAPDPEAEGKFASSLQFSSLPAQAIERLTQAGEPVWWKVDPSPIPAGSAAEVTVRLRREPRVSVLDVQLQAGQRRVGGEVAVREVQPRFRGVSFSPELDRIYLYPSHSAGGVAPERIVMNGRDVTEASVIKADADLDSAAVIVNLDASLREPEFICLEADYPDGRRALTSIRVWEPEVVYGMWGYPRHGKTPQERVRIYLQRLHAHNINTIMSHYAGEVRDFVAGDAGRKMCEKLGIRIMDHAHGSFDDPIYYYLPDEPDAHDFAQNNINPPGKRLGSLAQWVIREGERFRRLDPDTLLYCNVDNTYKPEQWYMYAQLPDVISADPYYAEQLHSVYQYDPGSLEAYTRPTYVYATGTIYQSAGAPKPMHLILHSCRFDMEEFPFRAPTPGEKRVEVYYALASGAKGISYWWYTPAGRYYGCGGDAPEMVALMTEIGLLGAEVRTAGPVLSRSCPVDLEVEGPRHLWMRTLVAGHDAAVLVVVNDNIASDRAGFESRPVENARISLKPPSWLAPAEVFEVHTGGTRKVAWESAGDGLAIDLGDVELTRMIILTSDPQLRNALQVRYDQHFAENVRNLLEGRRGRTGGSSP